MPLPFRQRKRRRAGWHPPGFNYCGPQTPLDGAPPRNPTDEVCMRHDQAYGGSGITFPGNLLGHYDADEKFISEIDELPANRPFYEKAVGQLGKYFFQAKQHIVPDRTTVMPVSRKRLRQLIKGARNKTYSPYTTTTAKLLSRMRAKRAKYGYGYGIKKRPKKSFRRARRTVGKFFKRKFKKSVASKLLAVAKRIAESNVPKKLLYSQQSLLNFNKLFSDVGPEVAFWVVPGYTGGQASAVSQALCFAGVTEPQDCSKAAMDSNITLMGGTAASNVNRTFFYNWKNTHRVTNEGNGRAYVTIYKWRSADNIQVTSHKSGLLQQMVGLVQNTTLFPNSAAGVGNVNNPIRDTAGTVQWLSSMKDFNPFMYTELKQYFRVKKLRTVLLQTNDSFLLTEVHPIIEYNLRIWGGYDYKKNVSWGYILKLEGQQAKDLTSDLLVRTSYPNISIQTTTKVSMVQDPAGLRDYVATYCAQGVANSAGLAADAMDIEGQAPVADA